MHFANGTPLLKKKTPPHPPNLSCLRFLSTEQQQAISLDWILRPMA